MNANNRDKFQVYGLVLISILMLMLGALVQPAKASPGTPPTPHATPQVSPTPVGGGNAGGGTTVIDVFHFLKFEDSTISDALNIIFGKVAKDQDLQIRRQIAQWTLAFGELLQTPSAGKYSDFSSKSIPVAAALAPALFILRLALYHWNKLLGDSNDAPMRVIGDWITSCLLALISGPFLDMIVRIGYWAVGAMIAPPANLAKDFVMTLTSASWLHVGNVITGGQPSWMESLLGITLGLAALLAVGGLILAFVIANSTLFLLAMLGPILAIASSIDELKWLRSLWLKAVIVVSLLPLAAGVIFNLGLSMPSAFSQGGILSGAMRVVFLFAAAGALLSLSGILGKLTIGTSVDAAKGILQAVGNIAATAGLAMSGVGAAAAPAAAGSGAAAGGASAGGAAAAPGPTGGGNGGGGLVSAAAHLDQAQTMNTTSTLLNSMGLGGAANIARGMGKGQELAARQDELNQRISKFGDGNRPTDEVPGLGFNATSPQRDMVLSDFKGTDKQFHSAYFGHDGVAEFMKKHPGDLNPEVIAQQHADEIGNFTRVFQEMKVDSSARPEDVLYQVAKNSNSKGILDILGRS